jgi:hypothetical protein
VRNGQRCWLIKTSLPHNYCTFFFLEIHESFFVFFNPFYLFVDIDFDLLGVDQNELSSLVHLPGEREETKDHKERRRRVL